MHINHSVQFPKQAKMKVAQSCLSLCDPMDCTVRGISPGQNTGVGSLSLQGIFPTQGSNPGLPHCRWILSQLSHKGSPRILGWVAGYLPHPVIKPGSPALQADSSMSYQRSPPTKDSPLITQVYVRNIIKAGKLKDRQEMYSSGIFDYQGPKEV